MVTVSLEDAPERAALTDRVDLYAFRSRRAFAGLVAEVFGREPAAVLGHLGWLLDQVERSQGAAQADAEGVVLTPMRRQAAEALLARADLLDAAAAAMGALGHVGEEAERRLAYLVATSRVLARPLSLLVMAPSGTGKSALLDAVTALLPPEDVVALARLTPQALYYMGEDAVRHRIVLVDEYEGQQEAEHAVRVLQSKGELTQAATVRGRAQAFTVRGPVAVMSGTTLGAIDPQNASRCLELTLDDSPAQTRRVQEAQARAWAGAAPRGAGASLEAWRDAQRLVAEALPVEVVIPFAPALRFPAQSAQDRRTGAKVLALVAAHAALHLRQRERDRQGRVVATLADYARVHALLGVAYAERQGDLTPRAARALGALAAAERPLTRRELASALGWTYMTAARALDDLVGVELVRVRSELPRRYELLGGAVPSAGLALTPPGALELER